MKNGKKNPTIVLGIIAIAMCSTRIFWWYEIPTNKVPTFARNGQNGMPGATQDGNGKQNQMGATKNAKNGAGIGFGGMQIGTVSSIDDSP
jgi:hypothetical protein